MLLYVLLPKLGACCLAIVGNACCYYTSVEKECLTFQTDGLIPCESTITRNAFYLKHTLT